MKPYLNLGCGSRFHPAWTNIDFVAQAPSVMAHDLRQGIPFADETFDLVYHSHVLEHFSDQNGVRFLRECARVLKPGGVIRVAVPDLEQIARLYLQALERAVAGDPVWQHHYDWLLIELYDQMVREKSGGRHADYLGQEDIPNLEFVLARQGKEVERGLESQRRAREEARGVVGTAGTASAPAVRPSWLRRTLLFRAARRLYRLAHPAQGQASPSVAAREERIRHLLGDEYELLLLGRFRRSGELHLRMYDHYSLGRALQEAGFVEARQVGAAESRVPDWSGFHLDTEPDGGVYKPDSLYMEAAKPVLP